MKRTFPFLFLLLGILFLSVFFTLQAKSQGATLLYSTDFEAVTGHGICPNVGETWVSSPLSNLGSGMSNGLDYSGVGSAYWIEGIYGESNVSAHSGNRCFGQSLVNAYRNQWLTWKWAWDYSNTYYYEMWKYFPADFNISTSDGWFDLLGYNDGLISASPFFIVFLNKNSTGEYLMLGWDNGEGAGNYNNNPIAWTLPRSQWFKLGVYVDRGTTDTYDGAVDVYINDVKKSSATGMFLKDSTNNGDSVAFVDEMYIGDSEGYYYFSAEQWTDDLKIYDDLPTEGGDSFAPSITILSPANITYNSASVSLSYWVNESTSWVGRSLDGLSNVTLTGNTTLSSLSEGVHSLKIYANDTSGNMGSSVTRYFTVDFPPEEPPEEPPEDDFSFSPQTNAQGAYVLGICDFYFNTGGSFAFQGIDNDTVIFTVINGTLNTTDSTVQIYASMGRVVFNSSSVATLNFTSLNPENLRLSVNGKSNFAKIGNSYIMSVPLGADMIIQWQFYPPDFLGQYFLLGEGLVGVGLMIFSPAWVTWEIKKHGVTQEAIERFGYAMLLFIVGFGLVIMYLWSA